MNSILVIHPYKYHGIWVFDDARVGLVQEAFVSGADIIIDRMVEHIPDAGKGVTMLFSAKHFPGCQHEFTWRREESGGNWYFASEYQIEGWLCPALFRYFAAAPDRIFVQVRPRSAEQKSR